MRNIFILSLLFITLSSASQEKQEIPKFPLLEDGSVGLQEVIITDLSADENLKRILSFYSEYSSKNKLSVIENDNLGLFIYKGSTKIDYPVDDKIIFDMPVDYNLRFDYKDGKIRFTIYNASVYIKGQTISGVYIPEKYYLLEEFAGDKNIEVWKGKKTKPKWGMLGEQGAINRKKAAVEWFYIFSELIKEKIFTEGNFKDDY